MDKDWEVIIEQIAERPETRVTFEVDTEELIRLIRELGVGHVIAVRNLHVREGRCPLCGAKEGAA